VKEEERLEFLVLFGYGKASLLEICALEESRLFDFEVVECYDSFSVIECTLSTARKLAKRLGGASKIAKKLSNDLDEALETLELPYRDKFNWTISAYECPEEIARVAKEELSYRFKREGLKKGRFIIPSQERGRGKTSDEPVDNNQGMDFNTARVNFELRFEDVAKRILNHDRGEGGPGFDFVIEGGSNLLKPIFAQTIATIDHGGFEERDFAKPHKDPRITLGPRIARMMINLSEMPQDGAKTASHNYVLDPFCGLGTILIEALCCGHSVIGSDIRVDIVSKCRENLEWYSRRYGLSKDQSITTLISNASSLSSKIHRNQSIGAIVTEPILLPTFKSNPGKIEALRLLDLSKRRYSETLNSLVDLLPRENSRLVFTTPIIVDSGGSFHEMMVKVDSTRPYVPRKLSQVKIQYPLQIETSKKKTVHRAINVLSIRPPP
jgi:tRNA G10  N-methylase Trm11